MILEQVSDSELQQASECKKLLQAKMKISLGKEYRFPDKMCGELLILPDDSSTKSPEKDTTEPEVITE